MINSPEKYSGNVSSRNGELDLMLFSIETTSPILYFPGKTKEKNPAYKLIE